ncbi:MAG: hypothetical protein WCC26_10575 [Terracidiphilus sp.]
MKSKLSLAVTAFIFAISVAAIPHQAFAVHKAPIAHSYNSTPPRPPPPPIDVISSAVITTITGLFALAGL